MASMRPLLRQNQSFAEDEDEDVWAVWENEDKARAVQRQNEDQHLWFNRLSSLESVRTRRSSLGLDMGNKDLAASMHRQTVRFGPGQNSQIHQPSVPDHTCTPSHWNEAESSFEQGNASKNPTSHYREHNPNQPPHHTNREEPQNEHTANAGNPARRPRARSAAQSVARSTPIMSCYREQVEYGDVVAEVVTSSTGQNSYYVLQCWSDENFLKPDSKPVAGFFAHLKAKHQDKLARKEKQG